MTYVHVFGMKKQKEDDDFSKEAIAKRAHSQEAWVREMLRTDSYLRWALPVYRDFESDQSVLFGAEPDSCEKPPPNPTCTHQTKAYVLKKHPKP